MEESDDRKRDAAPGAPDTPLPESSPDDIRDKCESEREVLTPRQTADCAGTDLAELYQNEEDGGS